MICSLSSITGWLSVNSTKLHSLAFLVLNYLQVAIRVTHWLSLRKIDDLHEAIWTIQSVQSSMNVWSVISCIWIWHLWQFLIIKHSPSISPSFLTIDWPLCPLILSLSLFSFLFLLSSSIERVYSCFSSFLSFFL